MQPQKSLIMRLIQKRLALKFKMRRKLVNRKKRIYKNQNEGIFRCILHVYYNFKFFKIEKIKIRNFEYLVFSIFIILKIKTISYA